MHMNQEWRCLTNVNQAEGNCYHMQLTEGLTLFRTLKKSTLI